MCKNRPRDYDFVVLVICITVAYIVKGSKEDL